MATIHLTSAGGVVFRNRNATFDIILISVGESRRWQLPKGLIDDGETLEATALREVKEETGTTAELLQPIDAIDYWYYGDSNGERVRHHKVVHFFLMKYQSGDVADHDDEVHEAQWTEINRAIALLAFDSEKNVVKRAYTLARSGGGA
ncbi:MAG: NUDIX hydrolase [Elainellaceae cyanobacterium]